MKCWFILFIVVVLFTACGPQKQFSRQFSGKSVTDIKEALGEPKIILDRAEGQVYVYEKEEELESTEISQGKLTLDPIITPKVIKTTRYYFTVKNDVVISTKLEEEYER